MSVKLQKMVIKCPHLMTVKESGQVSSLLHRLHKLKFSQINISLVNCFHLFIIVQYHTYKLNAVLI